MKNLLLIAVLFSSLSQAKVMKEGDKEYTCSPKVPCEDEVKRLRAENKRLRKELSERQINTVQVLEREKEVVVEKKVIKHHIVSLMSSEQARITEVSANNTTASVTAERKYVPQLTYQYQFDTGLVPLLGASVGDYVRIHLGVGYEF